MKIIPSNCIPPCPRTSPQGSSSSSLRRPPHLAREEHYLPLPSRLIPSRPRDVEEKPSAQGLENASKSNPSRIVYGTLGVVSSNLLTRRRMTRD